MKLKLNVGGVEIDYDGEEDFLKSTLPSLLETIAKYAGQSQGDPKPLAPGSDSSSNNPLTFPKHSTNTVAKLLDAQTGPDLIMAAVVKKIVIDGAETINRQAISSEMRSATSYFKRTYMNNLSAYLDTLTKADSLRLISENVYGLPAKVRAAMEPKIHE